MAVAAAGEAMIGVGLVTGSTTLFTAGTSTVAAGGTLAATFFGANKLIGPQQGANGASNATDGPRLWGQLTLEEARSTFLDDGTLHPETFEGSKSIIDGVDLSAPVQNHLTQNGSNIADWAKYTSATSRSPAGSFQVHFYMNEATGQVNYDYDYKVVFNSLNRR